MRTANIGVYFGAPDKDSGNTTPEQQQESKKCVVPVVQSEVGMPDVEEQNSDLMRTDVEEEDVHITAAPAPVCDSNISVKYAEDAEVCMENAHPVRDVTPSPNILPSPDIILSPVIRKGASTLPLQPAGTRRAYTGRPPLKRPCDDEEDTTMQHLEHRFLGLPASSKEVEQNRLKRLSVNDHPPLDIEEDPRDRRGPHMWTRPDATRLSSALFTTPSAAGNIAARHSQMQQGPMLYMGKLNEALEESGMVSIELEACTDAKAVNGLVKAAAMFHQAEVLKSRKAGVVNERLRNAIKTQASQYDTLSSTYDALVRTSGQKLRAAAEGYDKLEAEANIYQNRVLFEENRQVNDLLHRAMHQERQAWTKVKEKEGLLANKDEQLIRKHQTLLQTQAQLRQAGIEKENLLNDAESQRRRIEELEAQLT